MYDPNYLISDYILTSEDERSACPCGVSRAMHINQLR